MLWSQFLQFFLFQGILTAKSLIQIMILSFFIAHYNQVPAELYFFHSSDSCKPWQKVLVSRTEQYLRMYRLESYCIRLLPGEKPG